MIGQITSRKRSDGSWEAYGEKSDGSPVRRRVNPIPDHQGNVRETEDNRARRAAEDLVLEELKRAEQS